MYSTASSCQNANSVYTIYLEYFLAINSTNQIMMRMSDDATVASLLERQGRTDRYTDQSLDDDD